MRKLEKTRYEDYNANKKKIEAELVQQTRTETIAKQQKERAKERQIGGRKMQFRSTKKSVRKVVVVE